MELLRCRKRFSISDGILKNVETEIGRLVVSLERTIVYGSLNSNFFC